MARAATTADWQSVIRSQEHHKHNNSQQVGILQHVIHKRQGQNILVIPIGLGQHCRHWYWSVCRHVNQ